MMMRRLWIIGLLAILFSCSGSKSPTIPEILSETENGFVDMVFAVTQYSKTSSGGMALDMTSKTDTGEVAIRMTLGRDWKKGMLGGQITTYKGKVTATRIDGRSDMFIQFIDKAYGTELKPTAMKDTVIFTGISLEGNPNAPTQGPLKIKLFFESEKETEYAEAYLNLDLAHQKAWFNEKDPEYRSAIVNDMKK